MSTSAFASPSLAREARGARFGAGPGKGGGAVGVGRDNQEEGTRTGAGNQKKGSRRRKMTLPRSLSHHITKYRGAERPWAPGRTRSPQVDQEVGRMLLCAPREGFSLPQDPGRTTHEHRDGTYASLVHPTPTLPPTYTQRHPQLLSSASRIRSLEFPSWRSG